MDVEFKVLNPIEVACLKAAFRCKDFQIKVLESICIFEGLYICKQAWKIAELETKAEELNEGE